MAADWIRRATANKGGLHRSLGIPQGQRIPSATIAVAASQGGTVGAQARLAQTLEGLRPKKKPARRDPSMLARAAAGRR